MIIRDKDTLIAIAAICDDESDVASIRFELGEEKRGACLVSSKNKFAGQNFGQLDFSLYPNLDELSERSSVLMERYLIQCRNKPVVGASLISFEERVIISHPSLEMSEKLCESSTIAVEGSAKFDLGDASRYLGVRLEQAGLCSKKAAERTGRD